MKLVESNIQDWFISGDYYVSPEGYLLDKPGLKKNLCKFNSVPASLLNVDKKYNVGYTLEILKKAVKEPVHLVVDDDNKVMSVVDHRSSFVSDENYNNVVSIIQDVTNQEGVRSTPTPVSIRTTFNFEQRDNDSFFNDAFKRQLVIDRLPEGGLHLGTRLLRLSCTNGQLVQEKQNKKLFRMNIPDVNTLKCFITDVNNFRIDKYLHSIFFDGDTPYMASVNDYMEMRKTLSSMTDDDFADLYFPLEPITTHYLAHGTDVESASCEVQSHLPSGLEYYKCFNILTNSAKYVPDLSLENEIKISSFAGERNLKSVRAFNIATVGVPVFDESQVAFLMGDR